MNALRQLLTIDVRALAALRIGLATLILADLTIRSGDLVAHYTDVGILPRPARITAFDLREGPGTEYWWSLHLLNGTAAFQTALFLLAACFAVWLLLGYRTRVATAASWCMLVSLHSRLPVVLQGGDILLRALLFWSMFVPLGAAWSLDRRLNRAAPRIGTVCSAGSAALLLQTAIMYLFSAAAKFDPAWFPEGTAAYYALSLDMYVTRIGRQLLSYPRLLAGLTFGAWWLEWIGPILVFLPWRTASIRVAAVAMFWCFHLGLAMCLELGQFSYVAMVAWLPFLPPMVWDAVEYRLARARLLRLRLADAMLLLFFPRPASPCWSLGKAGTGFVSLILAYVLVWNYLLLASNQAATWPDWFALPAQAMRLEQQWSMFAPHPATEDGWPVLRGVLHDGSEVNLWRADMPLPLTKPKLVSAQYPNHRWRKYLSNFRWDADQELLSCLSDWLRWRWNREFSDGQPDREVRLVEIGFMEEPTPPQGQPLPAPRFVRLFAWDYEAGAAPPLGSSW